MKKLFLIGALFCASAGILASVSYRTTCGVVFTSTGPTGYPGGVIAYYEWLDDMNEYFCNEPGRPVPLTRVPDEEPVVIP